MIPTTRKIVGDYMQLYLSQFFRRDKYGQLLLTRRGEKVALVIAAAMFLLYAWLEGTVGLS